jgi:hypothetical protein
MKYLNDYSSVLPQQAHNEKRIVYGPEVYQKFRYSIIKQGPDQGRYIIYNR